MKKLMRWLLIAVAVMWVIHDPAGAALLAHRVIGWLGHAANSLSTLTASL